MEKRYVTILVLAMGAMVLLAGPLPCWAEEKAEEKADESVWHEDETKGRGGGFRRFELTDEAIEHIMSRLEKEDPAKAKELAKLREKDAEKFKAELREVMRERFGRGWGEHGKGGGRYGPGRGMEFGGRGGRGEPGSGRTGGKGAMYPMYRRRGPGFDEWLAENYPEEAKKLAELEEKNPVLYRGRYAICRRRLGRIYEASKEDPELAEILKEDLKLKERRNELLATLEKLKMLYDDSTPAAKKESEEKIEAVKTELEEVVRGRFDLIVRRKQIEFERLLKRLQELQERVKKSEAQVAKWKEAEFKDTSVKARLEELVGTTEKFRWE